MSDYTPTAEEVRGAASRGVTGEGFDRWLAEHDRQTAEKAWDEGQCTQLAAQAIKLPRGVTIPVAWNPYREASE